MSPGARVVFPAATKEEAGVALTILEKGVWGILIRTDHPSVVKEITAFAKGIESQMALSEFTIRGVRKISMGDRVCIDTITDMKQGEGMLIGNYSNAFFLVHSESMENPYLEPRPFRVNAGAGGKKVLLILQNAETIRLTRPNGEPISVVKPAAGDTVLGYTEEGGRHFGFKIKETINEK